MRTEPPDHESGGSDVHAAKNLPENGSIFAALFVNGSIAAATAGGGIMNNGVQLCEFEQDGLLFGLFLARVNEDLLALELHDEDECVRSISFTADMLESVISGELPTVESPDRQCAMVRNGEHIDITFSEGEWGVRILCDLTPQELQEALSVVQAGRAYVA